MLRVRKTDFSRAIKMTVRREGLTDRRLVDQFMRFVEKLPYGLVNNMLHELGDEVVESIRDYIRSQPSSWPPLNARYLSYKKKHPFLREDLLIASEDYIKSIEATPKVDRAAGRMQLKVGPPDRPHVTKNRKGDDVEQDISVAEIAKIHEFGTSKIPARPVWRPMSTLWGQKVRETAYKRVVKATYGKAATELKRLRKVQTEGWMRGVLGKL